MALSLGQEQIFKRRSGTVLRTDIIKFGSDIQFISVAGPPSGQYEVGILFFNNDDKKLYASANYKQNNLPTIQWFKFDGNVTDFSGNQNNGTLTGGSYEAGFYSKALKVDGSDDKLSIPCTEAGRNFSFNFYIKLPSDFVNGNVIYIYERFKDANDYEVVKITGNGANNGIINWRHNRAGTADESHDYSTVPITRDTWTYISIRVSSSGGTITMDVDGSTENDSIGSTSSNNFTAEPRVIGFSEFDSSFGSQDFLIDELKIWTGGVVPSTIDKSNLDKNQWASFTGTYVENT